jgi:protein-arginine deiminase
MRYELSLVAVLLSFGCAEDDALAPPPFGKDDTGLVIPDAGTSTVLETTRGPIFAAYLNYGEFPGLVGVPNLDDDDEDGTPDWGQAGDASGDDDFSLGSLVTNGHDVTLRLAGEGLRIYRGGDLVLGDGAGDTLVVSGESQALDLRFEYSDFLVQGTLSIEDATEGESFDVALTGSPMFFNHHLQASKEAMALKVGGLGYNNDAFIEGYEAALGDDFFTLNANRYSGDVWVQDEFEFGYASAPDAHLSIVFDTHRNGQGRPGDGLDDFPEDAYEGPGWLLINWGTVTASSLDYGGNLEISPPVTVDGVVYPYGRVYYGGTQIYQPHPETQTAIEDFQVQKPFMPDSTWLCVGHIDEFTSTVPDPSAPKGFRFVISDTRAGWDVLNAMAPDTSLPRYAPGGFSGHGIDDVAEILADGALHALNEEVQDIIDEQEALFRRKLGLTDEDIIYMPSLFEEIDGCWGGKAALIPGMANLIVADVDGQATAFLADPFLRENTSDQSDDPMIAEVRERMPASLDLVFLDDWEVYHMGLGEVHCGSNVLRRAANTWWEDAGHLIAQEGR